MVVLHLCKVCVVVMYLKLKTWPKRKKERKQTFFSCRKRDASAVGVGKQN